MMPTTELADHLSSCVLELVFARSSYCAQPCISSIAWDEKPLEFIYNRNSILVTPFWLIVNGIPEQHQGLSTFSQYLDLHAC